MDIFLVMVKRIIKEQELIIGPIAWDEANKVKGLRFSSDHSDVTIDSENPEIVNNLVIQYERLFGRASREVCKEAVRDIIGEVPEDKMPTALK